MNYYPLEELELDKEGINKKEDQKEEEEEEEEEETYLQKFINDNYYYILILLVIIISLSINTILDYQLMGKKLIQTGGYKRGMLSSLGSSARHGSYGLVYTAGSVIFTILIGVMVLIIFAPSLALVAVIFFSFRMVIPKILELKEL